MKTREDLDEKAIEILFAVNDPPQNFPERRRHVAAPAPFTTPTPQMRTKKETHSPVPRELDESSLTEGESDRGEIESLIEAIRIEQNGIDVEVGEFVDEHRKAEVPPVAEEVAEEGGLSAAQEAGDQGAAHPCHSTQAHPPVEQPVLEGHAHLVALHGHGHLELQWPLLASLGFR